VRDPGKKRSGSKVDTGEIDGRARVRNREKRKTPKVNVFNSSGSKKKNQKERKENEPREGVENQKEVGDPVAATNTKKKGG